MILSDFEWLRFVTFAFVAGAIVGATSAGAFMINGVTLPYAVAGAAVWCGAVGVVLHLTGRHLLTGGAAGDEDDSGSTEDTA
jgi:hypothetical protein